MSGNIKKILLFAFGVLAISLLFFIFQFAFIGKNSFSTTKTQTTEESINAPAEEPQVVRKKITLPEEKGNEKTDVNISRKKINIYIIDEKAVNTLPIVSFVNPDTFSPGTVAEAVILALGERAGDTKIGEVKTEKASVFIDLETEHANLPFGEVSENVEEMILNCISYSILDNFSDFSNIYFTVNGEAYQSDNLKLDRDKPFINQ